MKALIASAVLFRVGGLQQYTYRIAVGLHNAGVDTTVITCSRVLDESGRGFFTLPDLRRVEHPVQLALVSIHKEGYRRG